MESEGLAQTDGRGSRSQVVYDAQGRVAKTIDALGHETTYGYDALGRQISVIDPLTNIVYTTYDAEGRILSQRGATYPVDYGYDVYGNKISMTTYRDEALTNGDVTRWLYDEPSGLVTNKVYADGKGPRYDYTPDGKLARRTWARGVVTDYTYDNAGQLVSTTYSDNTPTITMSYDRVGNLINATTAGVVTNLYAYDLQGHCTNEWQNDFNLTRYYDTLGRSTGYAINGTRQTTIAYDSVGRIATMSVPSGQSNNPNNRTIEQFSWAYLPGSDLKASLQYPNGLTASWTYDANNQLLQVRNATPTNVISQFDYTYDAAGRRVSIAKSGSAFGDLSGSVDSYTYNARSELTSARRTKNGQPIPGFSEDFDYDPIGNRRSSATYNEKGEAQTSTYQANNLNQYTMRTTPGYAAVRGEADSAATITVNENPTFRLGSYYFGSDLFDNSSSGGLANLETYATLAQTSANGEEAEDLVSAETNQVYLAQSPETFAYDDDGNQTLITTKTGLWRVTYNGENRPIRWVRDSDNATLTMTYDHMGRRREKNAQRFFYDGYLQIANFHSTTTTSDYNYFIWDPTEPVATRPLTWTTPTTNHESPITNFYTHDGNKNVSEVIASDNGASAHYEYAPFGAVTVSCGTSAATNPWRFSSEYAEDDTATVYYNYRHYEPVMSRWLSRDPIEELGGTAFYVFCGNGSVCEFDVLGLSWLDFHPDEPPSEVGEWEALIPIYGSLRQFDVATYNGRWGASMWHGLMAVSDVCMVRAGLRLASKGMSACWKTGSHTWRATRSWYGKKFGLEKGVEVHHVYIPQKFIKKHEWIAPIANQPWNLSAVPVMRGLSSKQVHQAIHGCRVFVSDKEARVTFSLWEQYWYSSRHGAEATVLYFSDKLFVDLIMYLEDGATGDVGTDTLERVYDGELKSLQSEVESEEMEW